MKIALVSYSDSRGGAAVVTYRLMESLRAIGVDARMLVFSKESGSAYVYEAGSRICRMSAKIAERGEIFLHNGFSKKNLFKVSTAAFGCGITDHPFVKDADAIILGWVNQGLVSLDDIRKLTRSGKPVIQIMHDMWNMTGICHHSLGCSRFEQECGFCPFLGFGKGEHDLSFRVYRQKQNINGIRYVAVSNWLAEQARRSSLLRNREVTVIPNPFPTERFKTVADKDVLQRLGIDPGKRIILMGAARLDDPIKDLPAAIEALNIVADRNPVITGESETVFFGDLRDPSLLNSLRFPHRHIGRISDPELLANIFASAKVIISSSRFETLPGTLIEGQASGAIPVTFGNGGQKDIISHLETGYIATEHTPESLAEGIIWAINSDIPAEKLRQSVLEKFDSEVVARKFVELIERLASC